MSTSGGSLVWHQLLAQSQSQSSTPSERPVEGPRDNVSLLRKASSMKVTMTHPAPVTILSTIVKKDGETVLPGTERHVDELDTSHEGFLYASDIIALLQESHEIQENITVRYYHPEWAAWAKLPNKVKPAVKEDTEDLLLEVKATVQESRVNVHPSPASQNEGTNHPVVDAPSEGDSSLENSNIEEPISAPGRSEPFQEMTSSAAVLAEPEYLEQPLDKFSDFLGADPNGSVDNAWLIVERVGESAVPPQQGEEERTINGENAFVETYRSLLPVALQWFETRDLHPNSAQLYGAEGDILLSPEKLMKLDGLEAYFEPENNVERFLLFLAIGRDAFTTKGASRVTGRWKPKEDIWNPVPGLPGVLFQDLKWEDDPGQDWNENWNCFIHIIIPESLKENSESHCLAAVRFVQSPWKPPPIVRRPVRIVQTDIIAARPNIINPEPLNRNDNPGRNLPHGGNGRSEIGPSNGGQGTASMRSTGDSVFDVLDAERGSTYAPSTVDNDADILPPVAQFPEIEVPLLPNGEVDWDHSVTKSTFRQILLMLGDIERLLDSPEASQNLSLVLLSVDKLHPFIAFLKAHRKTRTVDGALVQAQNLLLQGLQIIHKEFMTALDNSSRPPEKEFDLREDLFRQLEEIQTGEGPDSRQTLSIPEMPDESSVRVLNALVSRLVVPEWKPRNGISFKDRRGEALVRNLRRLGVQEIRQDQVNQMRWEVLEAKMKLWMDQMGISIRILFAAERILCDRVLAGLEPLPDRCFAAVAGDSLRWLVGCGNILASSRRAPEKLITLLDMYSVVVGLMPTVEEFFKGKAGETYVRSYRDFVGGLGRVVKDTAKAFEQTILHEGAQIDEQHQQKGGARGSGGRAGGRVATRGAPEVLASEMAAKVKVQPLTSYVVNYLRLLSSGNRGYIETLDLIYRDSRLSGSAVDNVGGIEGVAGLFSRIMRALDHNLLAKSKALRDNFLEEVFLLNNMIYIIENVSSCEVGFILGMEWKSRHEQEIEKLKNNLVLLYLKKLNEGIFSLPKGDSRATAARLKIFNAELESLLQNKSYLHLADIGSQIFVCREIRRRVVDEYQKFLESHKDFIQQQRSVSKHFVHTRENVARKLAVSFDKEG